MPDFIREIMEEIGEYGCSLTPLPDGSYIARVASDDPSKPYGNAVVVSPVNEDVAEVRALTRLPTTDEWRKLEAALKRKGYQGYRYETLDGGIHYKTL